MGFKDSFKNVRVLQYLAAFAAALTAASNATHVAWLSPTLIFLTSDDSPIGVTITSSEASWIVSIRSLGSVCGCFLSIWTNEYLGRRMSLIVSTVPLLTAWIMIILAKSVVVLYVARFIVGLGSGLISTALPIYISEISDKDIRGRLTNILTVLGLLGSLYVYAVGPFVSYFVLAGTCAVLPLITLILCWFLPETPYYLAKKNKMDQARKAIQQLAAKSVESQMIEEKLQEIGQSQKKNNENKAQFWELLTKKHFRKPFLIVTGLKTVQHLSGIQPISAYMQTIIESSGSSLSSSYSSIIFGLAQFISAIVAGQVVDKIGRKPLLLLSAISCSLSLFAEGAYFYILEALSGDTSVISWLPLTALVIYEVMITIGITSLPYILVGELFTMDVKGYAISFNTIYAASLGFGVNKLYSPISEAWGTYTTFWIYGTTCIMGPLITNFFLPETKDKSFDEIQELLRK